MGDKKEQLDNMLIKHHNFLLKDSKRLLLKHKSKEDTNELLNFCILQVYNQLETLDEKIINSDSTFQGYMFKVMDNTLKWENSKFNRERRIVIDVELPEYFGKEDEQFNVDQECPDCSQYVKDNLLDLYNQGKNLDDIRIYIKIDQFRSTLQGYELILFDEHIIKGKSILQICKEIKVTVSVKFIYSLAKQIKQQLKEELNDDLQNY